MFRQAFDVLVEEGSPQWFSRLEGVMEGSPAVLLEAFCGIASSW